jgi:hypothetical protein
MTWTGTGDLERSHNPFHFHFPDLIVNARPGSCLRIPHDLDPAPGPPSNSIGKRNQNIHPDKLVVTP